MSITNGKQIQTNTSILKYIKINHFSILQIVNIFVDYIKHIMHYVFLNLKYTMKRLIFLKFLFLLMSVICVYGNNQHFEIAERNKDLIKQSNCSFASGDIENAILLANQYVPLEISNNDLQEDFIELIKLFLKNESLTDHAIKLLKKVGIENPYIAAVGFDHLKFELDRIEEGESLAKELLKIWLQEEKLISDINCPSLIYMAKYIDSNHYYEKLLEKITHSKQMSDPAKNAMSQIYDKRVKQKKIKSKDKINSITSMLGNLLYFDPIFCENYNVPLETIQLLIETVLYETSKDNDIAFNILHAIALSTKNYPFDIFISNQDLIQNPNQPQSGGFYHLTTHDIAMQRGINIHNSLAFKGTIIHEMAHKLMHILYNNGANPYSKNNSEIENIYKETIKQLESKLENIKEHFGRNRTDYYSEGSFDQAIRSLLSVKEVYPEEDHLLEYIVRYPQSIAEGTYNDPEVKEIMQPLADFWNQYIEPDLQKYIKKHESNSTYISECARENVFLNDGYAAVLKQNMNIEFFIKNKKHKIVEDPFYYFQMYEHIKNAGYQDLLSALKELAPSVDIWQSIIIKNPLDYFPIISNLKRIGDQDTVEKLKKSVSPDITSWPSIKVGDPSKYYNFTATLQEIYDNCEKFQFPEFDAEFWKQIIAENPMNYFEIIKLFQELDEIDECIPEEALLALVIEMLEKSYASNNNDWQSRFENKSGYSTQQLIELLSEKGREDLAEMLKQQFP